MRDNQQQQNPPKFADRFLKWFCRNELHEEIIGDLHELWLIEIHDLPRWKGTIVYFKHIILFLRPYAFKKRQNSNYIMLVSYIKFAWRNMLKHKGSTSLNVLSLSIGIASFIFIFVYLKSELSYDKFHEDHDLIHRIAIDFVDAKGNRIPDATTPPGLAPTLKKDFPEVQSTVRLFPSWGGTFLFASEDGPKYTEEAVMRTDSTFFDVFGFHFIHGNRKTALMEPGNIVLTESAALKYFGRTNVVGESIIQYRDEQETYKISGVIEDVPTTSHFTFDFLMLITFDNIDSNWGWYNYYTYAKMYPGTNLELFESKLQPFFEKYTDARELYYNQIYSQKLTDIHLKSHLKWELGTNGDINNVYIFAGLGLFILIISCLNYLNLTIAESMKRFKEIGVRKVFGAHKKSLISQFLVETVILTAFSLVFGSIISEILFNYLGGLLGLNISLLHPENLQIFMIICGGVLLLGLLAGLYPAFHLSSFQTILAIKGIVNRSGKSILNLRRSLLVIQFGISAFMIFGTLAVYKQLRHMQNMDKGFRPEQVLTLENSTVIKNQKALKSELLKIPGVSNVSGSNGVIGGLNWTTSLGYPSSFVMNYVVMEPDLVETIGMELIEGRNFDETKQSDKEGITVIVNETGFKELGITVDQIGTSIPLAQDGDSIINGTVIGVVKDFHFTDYKLAIKPFAFFYRDRSMDFLNIKLSSANTLQTLEQIETTWSQFSNGAPADYFFLESKFSDLLEQEDRLSKILLCLTILAFFIAFIGMFAIANITIKDQKKEIAIRKVLGASVASVTNRVTSRFIILVLIANLIAGPIAYFATQSWLDGFVYRTNIGFFLFAFAIGSTIVVAWSIVGYQSFKTAISNPVKSLRQD